MVSVAIWIGVLSIASPHAGLVNSTLKEHYDRVNKPFLGVKNGLDRVEERLKNLPLFVLQANDLLATPLVPQSSHDRLMPPAHESDALSASIVATIGMLFGMGVSVARSNSNRK